MEPGPLFDQYTRDYNATIQRAIGASGESVDFFAQLRSELLARSIDSAAPLRSILDFGCGIGNMTRLIATRFPSANVVGADVSVESLAMANELSASGTSNVRYTPVLPERLPFDTGSFDLAFASGVFHHIDRSEQVRWAAEVRRVLAPGGSFFLFEHNPFNPLTVRVVRTIPFDRGVQLLSARRSARLLNAAGFDVCAPYYYFFFPRALRILRPLEPYLRRIPIGAQYFVVGRS